MDNRRSKIGENKKIKENALFVAAFDLFTTKGIHDTAISDIVKKAGVAKGTFYLYFKDKYDILDRVILKRSTVVLKEAREAIRGKHFDSFSDSVIYFADFTIEYLKENRIILKLIHKNLSWALFRRAIINPEHYNEMNELFIYFTDELISRGKTYDEAKKILFMTIELIGSVCYSSIILGEPASIDEMKPILFSTVRKIIE